MASTQRLFGGRKIARRLPWPVVVRMARDLHHTVQNVANPCGRMPFGTGRATGDCSASKTRPSGRTLSTLSSAFELYTRVPSALAPAHACAAVVGGAHKRQHADRVVPKDVGLADRRRGQR